MLRMINAPSTYIGGFDLFGNGYSLFFFFFEFSDNFMSFRMVLINMEILRSLKGINLE